MNSRAMVNNMRSARLAVLTPPKQRRRRLQSESGDSPSDGGSGGAAGQAVTTVAGNAAHPPLPVLPLPAVPLPPAPVSADERATLFRLSIVEIDSYLSSPLDQSYTAYSRVSGAPIARVPIIRVFGTTPAGQKTCLHVHHCFPYLYIPLDDAHVPALTAACFGGPQPPPPPAAATTAEPPPTDTVMTDPSFIVAVYSHVNLNNLRLHLMKPPATATATATTPATTASDGGAVRVPESVRVYLYKLAKSIDSAMNVTAPQQTGSAASGGGGGRHRDYVYSISLVWAKSFFGFCPSDKPFVQIHLYEPSTVQKVWRRRGTHTPAPLSVL